MHEGMQRLQEGAGMRQRLDYSLWVQAYNHAGFRLNLLLAGMKDIDAIVQRFSEAEDANFSLFNYVNEVNAEVEKLEEQIAEIKVCCALHAVLCMLCWLPVLKLSLNEDPHWPVC